MHFRHFSREFGNDGLHVRHSKGKIVEKTRYQKQLLGNIPNMTVVNLKKHDEI